MNIAVIIRHINKLEDWIFEIPHVPYSICQFS